MAVPIPTQYEYSREIVDGNYDINNPFDVDENGNPVSLFTRIEEGLPGRGLTDVALSESTAIVAIDTLTPDEKQALDEIVAAHKAAAGTLNQQTSMNLMSENGTLYMLYVDNDGNLITQLME